jgi:uncharacterized protein YbjT (DUF2867 family)
MTMNVQSVFISGGTGYLGRALSQLLLERGHRVAVFSRPTSTGRVDVRVEVHTGDPFDPASLMRALAQAPYTTFVHLVGTPHPAPWKTAQFHAIDLPSLQASATAAREAKIAHFVYVSVAQPAPIMRSYIHVRQCCEVILAENQLRRSIICPWYVLGPGHMWPIALRPVYAILEQIPATRASAQRLGLITLDQMTSAMSHAIEHPPQSLAPDRWDVPRIRLASPNGSHYTIAIGLE